MTVTRAAEFEGAGSAAVQNEIWLLGQPHLRRYLHFVRDMTPGGAGIKQAELIDAWRVANDHYADLEATQAGIADTIAIRDLDPQMRAQAAEVAADPGYGRAFDDLPARFAMVELDKLVVPQPHVNLHHVERLKAKLAGTLAPAGLFAFCMPLQRAQAPVQMRRTGERKYTFWSESSDFRFHEPAMLRAENLVGHAAIGPVGGIIGLMVGFGSNFLTAIQSDDRLLLHNGHHRAYALRAAGFSHAPCLIQTVTRRDELNLIAPGDVCEAPAFYFKARRPPLLMDFFNPLLTRQHLVYKSQHMIELSFEVKTFEVRDMSSAG